MPIPALLAPALAAAMSGPAACTGSNLSIVSVTPSSSDGPDHTTFTLHVTVVNGGAPEAGNVLQSIVFDQNGEKVGEKGVPPLKRGKTYSYDAHFVRALGTAPHSTELRFIPKRDSPPLGPGGCVGQPFTLSV